MSDKAPEYIYKLTILGEGAVGKTSLRRKYLGNSFESNHIMTLGADFSTKDLKIDTGEIIRMQIWDIAGQDLFQSIRTRFLGGTSAAIAVFDITRSNTFFELNSWLNDLWSVNHNKKIPILIVGNKIDLVAHRDVNTELIMDFIETLKTEHSDKIDFIEYLETSAKTGENVKMGFENLAKATFDLLTK